MCSHDAGLHDVHVLPADGVIKAEELCIGGGHFKGTQLSHGAPPLVSYVVDHQQTAGICHLPIVPIVGLQHGAVLTVTDCGGFPGWLCFSADCHRLSSMKQEQLGHELFVGPSA